jgi:hypothetical protein
MNLKEYTKEWKDTPEYHKEIHDTFIGFVNDNEKLKAHRDFVESNAFGFGERSFGWLFKLIIDEMPEEFSFLEIGVFRGSSLSLVQLLADMSYRKVKRYGVSPMDTSDGHWDSDYFHDVYHIHWSLGLDTDYTIYHGSSTDKKIIKKAKSTEKYNILYIDGGHTKEVVDSDLLHYPDMIKSGGYLMIDDCCNDMNQPWGFFQGIQPVTDAVLEWEKTDIGREFEFVFNVVHLKVYKRK